jgi:hypothetical protein
MGNEKFMPVKFRFEELKCIQHLIYLMLTGRE